MEKTPDKTKAETPQNQAARVIRALSAGKQIVITVSRKPSIDQIVAAIGLASLINKQSTPIRPSGKSGTEIQVKTQLEPLDTKPDNRATRNAVVAFAGQVHPKIGFLQTDKIITKTVDNYRELVIAIDKNKADKLRYSLDKKMARVHISPFLSNQKGLSTKDLEIGSGDFNIDVLVAIGVNEASDLEPMIGDHIEMLKNCQTITMMSGQPTPSQIFGAEGAKDKTEKSAPKPAGDRKFKYQPINWCQPQACCLSEMIFNLAKEMRFEIDETVATIILTGFLSATGVVRSRNADAEQIEIISRLVKAAGIDNKQMIIDYIENEKLQLTEAKSEAEAGPAKQTVLAPKSTREQLLTEQEATKQVQSVDNDLATARAGREIGLRVSDEKRIAKSTDKTERGEDAMIRDLDNVQVDESGQIIHGAAAQVAEVPANTEPVAVSSARQTAIDPAKTIVPASNPITDADKLGQQSPSPAATSPATTAQAHHPLDNFNPV